jgi:hypothetical protein
VENPETKTAGGAKAVAKLDAGEKCTTVLPLANQIDPSGLV